DAYAKEHHEGSLGKTEMWHVLRAEPGARIAAGFRREITKEELRETALSGAILELLEWQEARAGNTFFLPAGTVHAVGEGLVMFEIQQNSDLTYRLYDYGRGRDLHLEHGMNVSSLTPASVRAQPQGRVLASCKYFTTSKISLAGTERVEPAHDLVEWLAV